MPKFQKNKTKVKAKQYQIKNSIVETMDDYLEESSRIRGIIHNHISIITDDPNNTTGDLTKFNQMMDELGESFISKIPKEMDKQIKEAKFCFNDIKSQFRRLIVDYSVSTPGHITPFQSANILDRVLTGTIDTRITAFHDIYDNLPEEIRNENKEFFNDFFAQIENVRLKNRPEDPEKDMMGVTLDGPLDVGFGMLSLPYTVQRDIILSSSTGTYPNDVEGHYEMANLKSAIESFTKKINDHMCDTSKPSATNEDIKLILTRMNEAIINVPLFESDITQEEATNANNLSYGDPLNQTIGVLNMHLNSFIEVFNDIPELKSLAETCKNVAHDRYVEEYEKLAKIAFSGDVTSDPDAMYAWYRMKSLSTALPELDKVFEKDRYSMMLTNDKFCREEIEAAEARLNKIKGKGYFTEIFDFKHYISPTMNKDHFRDLYLKNQIAEDCIMTCIIGKKALNEFSALANSIGKNNKNSIDNISNEILSDRILNRYNNRENLHNYVESFCSLAEKFPGIKDKEIIQNIENVKNKIIENTNSLKNQGVKENAINDSNQSITANFRNEKNELFKVKINDGINTLKNDPSILKEITSFGKNKTLDWEKLSHLLTKGSDEANSLRDAIIDAKKADTDLKYGKDNAIKLLNTSINYLHLKSSVPFRTSGQNRVAAAGSILQNVGLDYIKKNDDEFSKEILKEIKIEMMRNKVFRDNIKQKAAEEINLKLKENPNLNVKSGIKELDRNVELLLFAENCDLKFANEKNLGLNTKLNSSEKISQIDELKNLIDSSVKTVVNSLKYMSSNSLKLMTDQVLNNSSKDVKQNANEIEEKGAQLSQL